MLDTRIEGRDRQYDNFGDADGGMTRYITGMTPVNGVPPDASRHMISSAQKDWSTSGLTASSATWQFLGNQDIMARMWFPASVLRKQATAFASPPTATLADVTAAINDYLTAKATRAAAGAGALTPTQAALLNPALNPTLPYNLRCLGRLPTQRDAISDHGEKPEQKPGGAVGRLAQRLVYPAHHARGRQGRRRVCRQFGQLDRV